MEAYVLSTRGDEEEDIGCLSSGTSSTSNEVELADDASSSGSTAAHFEMASLMSQLPIKRGLSKFFDGKSQSFASLAEVGGLEDLPKPPPAKRLKASRSCGLGLEDVPRLSASAGKKAASRTRARPRKVLVVRTRLPITTRPGAVAGQPLLFA